MLKVEKLFDNIFEKNTKNPFVGFEIPDFSHQSAKKKAENSKSFNRNSVIMGLQIMFVWTWDYNGFLIGPFLMAVEAIEFFDFL